MIIKILTLVIYLTYIVNAVECAALISDVANTELSMQIQTLLEEYVEEGKAVGIAVGLIDQGKVTYLTYGQKSIKEETSITKNTVFEIGSITKVFTTLVLADMVFKNEIQLDDPIEIYLSGFKVPEKNGKKITIRHLATHTSGIACMPDNFHPQDMNNPYADYTIQNLYDYLSHCVLQSIPGEQFEYSNIGMGLLGHILILRTGQKYEELVQSAICNKLGMKRTSISLTPEMQSNFANGHHLGTIVEHWDIPELAGTGALRSTIDDMTQFLAVNMGVSESSITPLARQCHQRQYTLPTPEAAVGLGWMLLRQNDTELIWHNGGTGGFRSYIGFNSKIQRGIVILSNSTFDWPDELGNRVLNLDLQ